MAKLPKSKKCKNCKESYTPTRPLQQVCGYQCAAEYSREQRKKKAAKDWRKEKKVLKEKLDTKTDLEKKLQTQINAIVREIDKGHPCISSGRPLGKNYDAGHFYSVGSNPQIRFHLFNNFAQSVEQNQHQGGNPLGYLARLKEVFSPELQEYCFELRGHPAINLSKDELRAKTSIARSIVKWLKLQDRQFTHEERISLRERFQAQLGIYEPIKLNQL